VPCLLTLTLAPPMAGAGPSIAEGEAAPTTRADADVPRDSAPSTGPASVPTGDPGTTLRLGNWRVTWDDALRFELRRLVPWPPETAWFPPPLVEGRPLISGMVGLKLQVDGAAYDAVSGLPDVTDGVELRRGRLFTEGELFLVRPIGFKVEFGFTKESLFLNDFYLALRDLPVVGTLKVGQMQAPFSLDRLTSSLDTMFMERAAPVDAFAPGYLAGLSVQRHSLDDRVTGALGWFSEGTGDDTGDASGSLSRLVGRVTWRPYDDASSASPRLVHLGLSGSHVFSPSVSIRYRSRPESHLAPYLVDTGDIDAQMAGLVGLEAAVVHGPFSLQGEGFLAGVDPHGNDPLMFWGFYLSGSWFLTGESRPYDRRTGVFSAVVPREPFSIRDGRPGAWEWAVRWSPVDLDAVNVHGGRMGILSTGLNWYLDRHWRVTVEYLFTRVDGPAGEGALHTVQSRVQAAILTNRLVLVALWPH
jgi:phosphate-selective porin OprO and OprP